MTDAEKIQKAIEKGKTYAPIAREFRGFIILAQNEYDYNGKQRNIANGQTNGFFTIEGILER